MSTITQWPSVSITYGTKSVLPHDNYNTETAMFEINGGQSLPKMPADYQNHPMQWSSGTLEKLRK